MAKRFCDTEIWQKEWFQELSLKQKVLLKYIFENCDAAGIWEINFRLASFIIGETISKDDILAINSKKKQFDFLSDSKIFVIDFIKFQYGVLSENCKPHKSIIEKLKNYGLYQRVSEGYTKGIQTLEEKEQEQDKEKEKDNLLSFGSFLSSENSEEEKTIEEKKQENLKDFYGEFKNVYLPKNRYDILATCILNDTILNELINELSEAIERSSDKYKRYDERFPDAHYLHLKAFWKFRREHPEKFLPKNADSGGKNSISEAIEKAYAKRQKQKEALKNGTDRICEQNL